MTGQHGDPYADTAEAYLLGGWHPFPLPYAKKIPPPVGFTGYTAEPITRKFVDAWLANGCRSAGKRPWNIGLHMPDGVIGIDVDHYDEKRGGDTITRLEQELGPLPDTWRSSARGDLQSGIRFYRVPLGRMWTGDLGVGSSVEIISPNDRFAVVWPSVHDKTGRTYTWQDPEGFPSTDIPEVGVFPDLPAAWVQHLDKGPLSDRDLKADLATSDAWQWLQDHTEPGKPCQALRKVVHRAGLDLEFGNDHHGAIRGPVLAAVRMGEQGHHGAVAALQDLRDVFEDSLDGHRAWNEAEWVRLVVGAVAIVTVQDQRTPLDDLNCCGPETEETADLGEVLDEEATDRAKGSTWAEISLDSVLDGTYVKPMPTVGSYGDHALFYPGMVNGVAGESGAGKSWVALVATVQEIREGQHVVYVDFEADVGSVVHRLLDMGGLPEDIRKCFHYVQPGESLGEESREFFREVLERARPSLVVLDSTGESMALEGAKPNDDDETARWFRRIPTAIARFGPAVVILDHMTKADGGLWPIGSQRKRAAISGAQYVLKIDKPFDRDTPGGSNLVCAKDRHGNYAYARLVARLSVHPTEDDLAVDLVGIEADTAGERALSDLERRILLYVDQRMREVHGQPDDEGEIMEGRPNKEKIKKDVRGKNASIIDAVDHLVERGLLIPEEVRGGKRGTITLYEPGVRDFDIVED